MPMMKKLAEQASTKAELKLPEKAQSPTKPRSQVETVQLTVSLMDDSIRDELAAAGDREKVSAIQNKGDAREAKHAYASKLSNFLARRFANLLRQDFPGILPNEAGAGLESRARTAKGYKKLDVNYSTPELGLGLGVSIKTLNFRDPKSKRYTKNVTRIDNELRAEASDYHERQPYAVMIGVLFLPLDACDDGRGQHPSSFGHAVQTLRFRAGRVAPSETPTLFERVFIGLYDITCDSFGRVKFFDVRKPPPKQARPSHLLSLDDLRKEIVSTYDIRNEAEVAWADVGPEIILQGEDEGDDEGEDDEG